MAHNATPRRGCATKRQPMVCTPSVKEPLRAHAATIFKTESSQQFLNFFLSSNRRDAGPEACGGKGPHRTLCATVLRHWPVSRWRATDTAPATAYLKFSLLFFLYWYSVAGPGA